jgi:hypothetical protein
VDGLHQQHVHVNHLLVRDTLEVLAANRGKKTRRLTLDGLDERDGTMLHCERLVII